MFNCPVRFQDNRLSVTIYHVCYFLAEERTPSLKTHACSVIYRTTQYQVLTTAEAATLTDDYRARLTQMTHHVTIVSRARPYMVWLYLYCTWLIAFV